MTLKVEKTNVDTAWKIYNYLNIWEDKVFGGRGQGNVVSMFILTLVALHNKLALSEITNKLQLPYKDVYKYIDSLTRYYKFLGIDNTGNYVLTDVLLKSIKDSDITVPEVNEEIFCTVMSNLKYHTQIFQENLTLKGEVGKFKLMQALLNPVISNPIHASDCRQLSKLGYMKFRPQKKEFKLNEIAYRKDWVGTSVL